jgi:hypothetical protein
MLAGVGAVAVHGEESWRSHPAVATSYGTGLALIVDEFALLLDLKDVYWAKQGRVSVDIAVGGIAVAGSYFAALPVLRALRREAEHEAAARRADSAQSAPAHPAASGRLFADLAARELANDVELADMPGVLLH